MILNAAILVENLSQLVDESPEASLLKRILTAFFVLAALIGLGATPARADADMAQMGVNTTSLGLQPLTGAIPASAPAPGESRLFLRPDGTYQAIGQIQGKTYTFHLVERMAPWTLKPGLTVMARTYDGVVPGPTLVVPQGAHVVIDYRNDLPTPDTIHLHGIHGIPLSMDGVPGLSQAPVPEGGRYVYRFTADQSGTFLYHTHDDEAMLDSGLYGGIIVEPGHPLAIERHVAEDFLEILSSWEIQSGAENHFTINGKEYPATFPLNVHKGDRFRIRWINISGEEFHTMHTHGHYQLLFERDACPLSPHLEDTVLIGPGQRADVIVKADQQPGNWLVHCHVTDHTEDASGMPAGLITVIHYIGTPLRLTAMDQAMIQAMGGPKGGGPRPLGFWMTVGLGAFAGLTVFLGLPVARARKLDVKVASLLNAVAVGILAFLVVEIAQNAIAPVSAGIAQWHAGLAPFPLALSLCLVLGLGFGLVGLSTATSRLARRGKKLDQNPIAMATMIAMGIGAHNFGEGLAIGASAASGATALAIGLIVGFALHNATEGFGIAAPMAGRAVPSWKQVALFGLLAGGPTFAGTVIGYRFDSPILSVLFLAMAVGALLFVIGELWGVLKRTGLTAPVTAMMTMGFVIALATELMVDLNGG